MAQLITLKNPKLGPVNNFTACIYIYICMYTYTQLHTHKAHTNTQPHTHNTHTHTHAHTHTLHTQLHTHNHSCVRMHRHMRAHIPSTPTVERSPKSKGNHSQNILIHPQLGLHLKAGGHHYTPKDHQSNSTTVSARSTDIAEHDTQNISAE